MSKNRQVKARKVRRGTAVEEGSPSVRLPLSSGLVATVLTALAWMFPTSRFEARTVCCVVCLLLVYWADRGLPRPDDIRRGALLAGVPVGIHFLIWAWMPVVIRPESVPAGSALTRWLESGAQIGLPSGVCFGIPFTLFIAYRYPYILLSRAGVAKFGAILLGAPLLQFLLGAAVTLGPSGHGWSTAAGGTGPRVVEWLRVFAGGMDQVLTRIGGENAHGATKSAYYIRVGLLSWLIMGYCMNSAFATWMARGIWLATPAPERERVTRRFLSARST